jgi:hypothetical protein
MKNMSHITVAVTEVFVIPKENVICKYSQEDFSSPQRRVGPGANPTSYPVGAGGTFPEGKASGAWS